MNLLADCHLHFEGCLPIGTLERLARSAGHPFADRSVFESKRSGVRDAASFLSLYAELCRLFRQPEDYALAARDIAAWLWREGVGYAEIYVSPEIFRRMGLDSAACLLAIHEGFQVRSDACDCRILLDAVRQWGPDAADRVLDLYEKSPLPSVVGFGMGGDENALPAPSFAGVYARARALGLKTSVHAGEWGGPDSVREALDCLRPDRLDHGIAAALEDRLLERLADERTVLCVAPSGNRITGALARFGEHPLHRLLEAGVRVALSADDPLLFATSTTGEYQLARRELGLSTDLLRKLAENSWRAAFCSSAERAAGLKGLSGWSLPEDGKR